ncbi:hypothetical protein AB0K09_20020, partial [Streptomyces sp. NPDC049577]
MRSAVRSRTRAALAAVVSGLLAAGLMGGATTAQAAPTATGGGAPRAAVTDGAPLVGAGSDAGRRLRATGRLVGGGGTTCTATLVHATGKPDPAAKALILSNGHCVNDMMGTNE